MRHNMGRLDLEGVHNVVFDGHDLSEAFEVLDINPGGFPEVTDLTAELPGDAGEHYFGRRLGARDVTVSLSLHTFTTDPLEILREWRRYSPLLTRPTPGRLYLDDEMYLMAVLTGETPISFLGERALVEVTFRCHDPYFHGETHTIALDPEQATAFRIVSQCDTWPTLDLGATGSTVEVREKTSGLVVAVPDAQGKTLHVDTNAMRVEDDDGTFVPVDMAKTDFFPLSPNVTCEVTITGATGTLTYEERAL